MDKLPAKLSLLCLIIILLLSPGCRKKPSATHNQALWTSEDPFTIPLRQRLNKFEKGNLVYNPSFESGKYFFEKTDNRGYIIDGWKETGRQVHWVSETDSTGVRHYIEINRDNADVTDETGEGITSDFIKVIPGNYSLHYKIKLKNIVNPSSRLGTRRYDAIDIRIYYYDRNKLRIDDRKYLPFIKTKVDQSFKGYPFSAYWVIDSLDWTEVRGRTYHYPYDEGDIPNDARYVRIFLGLKMIISHFWKGLNPFLTIISLHGKCWFRHLNLLFQVSKSPFIIRMAKSYRI